MHSMLGSSYLDKGSGGSEWTLTLIEAVNLQSRFVRRFFTGWVHCSSVNQMPAGRWMKLPLAIGTVNASDRIFEALNHLHKAGPMV